jgi:hypothetical protein
MTILTFDLSKYEVPKSNFDPLPSGEYLAIVTENQMKATKSGTGEYLELVIQIVDGEYSGRKIWERLNIYNQSEQAQNMAFAALTALSTAVDNGIDMEAVDISLLIDVPFTIVLEIDRKDPTRNRVKGYKAAGAASAPVTRSVITKAAPAATKPWERK